MASERPGSALSFGVCLLCLVGLPPMVGFVGEFGVLRALVEHSEMRWMAVIVALELAVCAWVALRIIVTLLFGDEPMHHDEPIHHDEPGPWPGRVAAAAALASIGLGLGGQELLLHVRVAATTGSFEPGDPDRVEWLEERREAWALEEQEAEAEAEPEASSDPESSERKMSLDP